MASSCSAHKEAAERDFKEEQASVSHLRQSVAERLALRSSQSFDSLCLTFTLPCADTLLRPGCGSTLLQAHDSLSLDYPLGTDNPPHCGALYALTSLPGTPVCPVSAHGGGKVELKIYGAHKEARALATVTKDSASLDSVRAVKTAVELRHGEEVERPYWLIGLILALTLSVVAVVYRREH